MASITGSPGHDARQVAALLALPEIVQFITDLDGLRWTGRPGNGSRVMVGAMLVKAVYALPTSTRTARLIAEHDALQDAIGGAPSQWAIYRFAAKFRAVDTPTGLPVEWHVRTAKDSEKAEVPGLLDEISRRGFKVDAAVLDKGYDAESVYSEIESRHIRLIIPLMKTQAVKDGKHKPPVCDHGTWTSAGSDAKRGASKWRCPTGECNPKSVWIKGSRLHLLVPRSTDRFRQFYRQRGAVEREFGGGC